jgi:hypothetical protein
MMRNDLFPAFFHDLEPPKPAELIEAEDQASCFYHEGKQAELACEECGRFICATCEVKMHSRRLCPGCVERLYDEMEWPRLINSVYQWDSLALTVSVLTMLCCQFLGLFTLPFSIFVTIKYWNTPMSILPRSRWRFLAAIFCSTIATALSIGMIYMIIKDIQNF